MKRIVTVELTAEIQWVVWKDRTTGMWVGACDPLKLTAEGETHGDLMQDIDGVLQDLFRELVGSGDLERFLSDRGWRKETVQVPLPTGIPLEDMRFDVPFTCMKERPSFVHA